MLCDQRHVCVCQLRQAAQAERLQLRQRAGQQGAQGTVGKQHAVRQADGGSAAQHACAAAALVNPSATAAQQGARCIIQQLPAGQQQEQLLLELLRQRAYALMQPLRCADCAACAAALPPRLSNGCRHQLQAALAQRYRLAC